jgi:hypothetical protein
MPLSHKNGVNFLVFLLVVRELARTDSGWNIIWSDRWLDEKTRSRKITIIMLIIWPYMGYDVIYVDSQHDLWSNMDSDGT